MNRIVMLDADSQNMVARENGYEMRVFARAFDLAAAFEELEHLLDLLGRAKAFQEVSLLIKLYIIGWTALSDILANVINEVFDLGYAEQDINSESSCGIVRFAQPLSRLLSQSMARQSNTTVTSNDAMILCIGAS